MWTMYSTPSHFTPNSEDPKVQDFLADFEAEYSRSLQIPFAALAYDAAQLVFDAICEC